MARPVRRQCYAIAPSVRNRTSRHSNDTRHAIARAFWKHATVRVRKGALPWGRLQGRAMGPGRNRALSRGGECARRYCWIWSFTEPGSKRRLANGLRTGRATTQMRTSGLRCPQRCRVGGDRWRRTWRRRSALWPTATGAPGADSLWAGPRLVGLVLHGVHDFGEEEPHLRGDRAARVGLLDEV